MTDQTDAPNEVKIHVTIDREQAREAARLAAELFITEYASRLVEAVDPNYLDDEPVVDCGCPPRVHVNPERADWLDDPIPVPRPEAAPADVDPDEALAKVLYHAVSPFDGGDDLVPWDEVTYRDVRDHWLGVARAAREYIEANERHEYDILMREVNEQVARAEKAEGRAERLQQRQSEAAQEAQRKAAQYESEFRKAAKEQMRAEKAEADLACVTEERDKYMADSAHRLDLLNKAQVKADRYDALRADVEAQLWIARTSNFRYTIERFESILARDDERAAKGVQS